MSETRQYRIRQRSPRSAAELEGERNEGPAQPRTVEEQYQITRCPVGAVRVFLQLLDGDVKRLLALTDMNFIGSAAFVDSVAKSQRDPVMGDTLRSVWLKNMSVRFQMKRLLNSWLTKKSKQRTVLIPNFETMDEPVPSDAICWYDLDTRCYYVIDYNPMIRSIKMYLTTSTWGIPDPQRPRNPITNAPLSHGQLITVAHQIFRWFGSKGKSPPKEIVLLAEEKYNLRRFQHKYKTILSYSAAKEQFKDLTSHETVIDMFDVLENWLTIPEIQWYIRHFRLWVCSTTKEEDKDLQRQLSSLIPDLLQFITFKYYVRPEWASEYCLETTVRSIWYEIKKAIHTMFPRRPSIPSAPVLTTPPRAGTIPAQVPIAPAIHRSTSAAGEPPRQPAVRLTFMTIDESSNGHDSEVMLQADNGILSQILQIYSEAGILPPGLGVSSDNEAEQEEEQEEEQPADGSQS